MGPYFTKSWVPISKLGGSLLVLVTVNFPLKCIEFVDRVSNCIHNDPRIPSRTEDDQRRLIREIQICITMFDDDGSEIM